MIINARRIAAGLLRINKEQESKELEGEYRKEDGSTESVYV